MKVDSDGEAFNATFEYEDPISVKPGIYTMSLYTLVNCGIIECETAGDMISVYIKDGDVGTFNSTFNITGRCRDEYWIKNYFNFAVQYDKIWVSFMLQKLTNI